MKRKMQVGSTSVSLPIFIQDSSSTTGAGLGSLVFSTSGLVAEYRKQGQSSWTAISLVTATLGTFTSGGFIADGSLTGGYEFSPPDAAFASSAKWVAIRLRGATNMLPVLIEVELDAVNYQSATAFIAGVNSLAPPTNWNLLSIDSSGRIDLGKWLGNAPDALSSGKVPADLKLWLTAAPAALSTNGYVQAMLLRWLTDNAGGTPNALISARVDSNAQVVGDKTGYTASTVSDKTGYSLSSAGVQAIWDALTSALTTVGSIGKLLVDNINATISSRSTYAGGAVASVTAGVTVTTNNDKTGYGLSAAAVQAIWDALTSALTTVGSIGKLLVTNIDAAISSRMATFSYTAPPTVVQVRQEMDANSTRLDANVSSRMATFTLPTNFSVMVIGSDGRVVASNCIRKNTALANFEFVMYDSGDHLSPKPSLSPVTGTVSIDGGTFGALTNAVSEVASGVYKINLAAADVNGTDITLKFTATGADTTLITFLTG